MTKSLSEARNDTGRIAYCGPMVISAITGYPVSRIETLIHEYRNDPKAAEEMIVGTHTHEVAAALAIFGLGMEPIEDYLHLEKKERPTVWFDLFTHLRRFTKHIYIVFFAQRFAHFTGRVGGRNDFWCFTK